MLGIEPSVSSSRTKRDTDSLHSEAMRGMQAMLTVPANSGH